MRDPSYAHTHKPTHTLTHVGPLIQALAGGRVRGLQATKRTTLVILPHGGRGGSGGRQRGHRVRALQLASPPVVGDDALVDGVAVLPSHPCCLLLCDLK